MATCTIAAGKHYDNHLFSSLPRLGTSPLRTRVRFLPSCAYELPPYNQDDVNKLCGFTSGLRLWRDEKGGWDWGTHWNSARLGWRWSASAQKIQLLAYCYVRGQRTWDEQLRFPVVAQLSLDEVADCVIEQTPTQYVFTVTSQLTGAVSTLAVQHQGAELPRWGLTLGLYFGGSLPAPHAMQVELS